MMRSPPPPVSQQQQTTNSYGNPYQPQQPGQAATGAFGPGFGGFINDPTAQMGFQVGKGVAKAGQDYVEQNVSHPLNTARGPLVDC
jgi:protein transport protein YIF1